MDKKSHVIGPTGQKINSWVEYTHQKVSKSNPIDSHHKNHVIDLIWMDEQLLGKREIQGHQMDPNQNVTGLNWGCDEISA